MLFSVNTLFAFSHMHGLIFHYKTFFEKKLAKRNREIRIKGRGEKPEPTLKYKLS